MAPVTSGHFGVGGSRAVRLTDQEFVGRGVICFPFALPCPPDDQRREGGQRRGPEAALERRSPAGFIRARYRSNAALTGQGVGLSHFSPFIAVWSGLSAAERHWGSSYLCRG